MLFTHFLKFYAFGFRKNNANTTANNDLPCLHKLNRPKLHYKVDIKDSVLNFSWTYKQTRKWNKNNFFILFLQQKLKIIAVSELCLIFKSRYSNYIPL